MIPKGVTRNIYYDVNMRFVYLIKKGMAVSVTIHLYDIQS